MVQVVSSAASPPVVDGCGEVQAVCRPLRRELDLHQLAHVPEDFLQVHCLPALQGIRVTSITSAWEPSACNLDRALALAGTGLAGLRGGQVADPPARRPARHRRPARLSASVPTARASQRQPPRRVCACLTVYPPLRVPPRPAGAARGASKRSRRPALPSTSKVLRLCSSAATIAPAAPSRPKAAAATIARVQPRPIATLTLQGPPALPAEPHAGAEPAQVAADQHDIRRGQAMSAAGAIATPTTPAFSASESLMPSPTTIGRKPLPISAPTWRSLSPATPAPPVGESPPATASATARRSPVSNSCRPRPSSRRSARPRRPPRVRCRPAAASRGSARPAIPAIGPHAPAPAGVDAQLLEQFGPAEGGFARRCSCDHAEPLAFADIAQWMIGIVRRQGCQRSAHRMAAGGTEAGGQAQHRRHRPGAAPAGAGCHGSGAGLVDHQRSQVRQFLGGRPSRIRMMAATAIPAIAVAGRTAPGRRDRRRPARRAWPGHRW